MAWTNTKKAFALLGNDIISRYSVLHSADSRGAPSTTASSPRSTFPPLTPSHSNRGFKSANILLNGQVPMRARLTTYQ